MTLIDTLTPYTTGRLRHWGLEIGIGGGTYLGMPTINILHKDHNTIGGSRLIQISDETWVTEMIINEIRLEAPDCAVVLRAAYCGHGRWTEERRRVAEFLLGRRLSRRKFFRLHDDGFRRVREFFELMVKLG